MILIMKMLILRQDSQMVMNYIFNIVGSLVIASALTYILYSNFIKDHSKNQMTSNETVSTFDLLTQIKEL